MHHLPPILTRPTEERGIRAKPQARIRRGLRWALGGAILALLLVVRFHFGLTFVVGESMSPTYHTGDLLLIHKQTYPPHDWERGDIVVARTRHGLLVKRVAGLPGEEVEVKLGKLIINGQRMKEPHRINPGVLQLSRGRLGQGKLALLGDNRALPPSMVMHAVVSADQIVGKVIYAIRWP